MNVLIFDQQSDLSIDPKSVTAVVKEVLASQRVNPDELAIYFISEEEICALHAEFFDDPSPTDCITFPIDASYLGDAFVCPKVAKEWGGDPYQEITLYVVHCLLHLMGYDDVDPSEKQKMEQKQNELMEQLIEKNLLIYP